MPDQYEREYPLFALCGLNCGLCVNYVGNTRPDASFRCPGCGGDAFCNAHGSCALLACAKKHGGVEYCFQCEAYPCKHYEAECEHEFFLVGRNVRRDFERARQIGAESYVAEQEEKAALLRHLLDHYNDGRKKTFFCVAVNLLEIADIKRVLAESEAEITPETPLKERAKIAAKYFNAMGEKRNVVLKLLKKK